jgi:hypothetical protein
LPVTSTERKRCSVALELGDQRMADSMLLIPSSRRNLSCFRGRSLLSGEPGRQFSCWFRRDGGHEEECGIDNAIGWPLIGSADLGSAR